MTNQELIACSDGKSTLDELYLAYTKIHSYMRKGARNREHVMEIGALQKHYPKLYDVVDFRLSHPGRFYTIEEILA